MALPLCSTCEQKNIYNWKAYLLEILSIYITSQLYATLVTMDTATLPTCTRASLSFCSTSPNLCPSFSQSDCSCPSFVSRWPLDSESSQCSARDWPFSQQVPNTGARVLYSDFRFCSVCQWMHVQENQNATYYPIDTTEIVPCSQTSPVWTFVAQHMYQLNYTKCDVPYSGKFSPGKKFSKASANILCKKFARINFAQWASREILTRCILLNQHMVD